MEIVFTPNFDSKNPIKSQICTGHDSSAVVTYAKLWPDLIIIHHVRATWIFTRFELWTHKLFVKWVQVVKKDYDEVEYFIPFMWWMSFLAGKSDFPAFNVLLSVFRFIRCDDYDSSEDVKVHYKLILRRWHDLNPGGEFRCFVKNGKIIGGYYNENPCAWLLWHWSSRGQLTLCNPRGR